MSLIGETISWTVIVNRHIVNLRKFSNDRWGDSMTTYLEKSWNSKGSAKFPGIKGKSGKVNKDVSCGESVDGLAASLLDEVEIFVQSDLWI